jgi:hypothetical protein
LSINAGPVPINAGFVLPYNQKALLHANVTMLRKMKKNKNAIALPYVMDFARLIWLKDPFHVTCRRNPIISILTVMSTMPRMIIPADDMCETIVFLNRAF